MEHIVIHYSDMLHTIRIIGAILCVLSIVLSWIVSHSLLKNAHSMMKQIKLIGGGKANKKIEISSHGEIGALADSFNQLLSKPDSVNQRIIAEGLEKERIKYELLNLQLRSILTQIAPHLIGNLLGALSAYAVVGQTDKVESLSIHASNYIRSNAKCSEREYSTLGEEFQTIDNYIAMYQEIFDQPETYESHFEQEACRNMLVPSMLIHPLVENSLKYCGSGGTHGMANIRISAKHTEKLLELHIEDTSSPFPEDVLAALEEMKRTGEDTEHKLGFGLAGTIRRLSLLYGDDYDFILNSPSLPSWQGWGVVCVGLILLFQKLLQVFLRGGDGGNSEVLHQIVQYIGRNERRKRGAETDVLNAQVQQGQQDAHRLLLIPGKHHGQRQVVHAAAECVSQGNGDLNGAVGVVALPHIHQTGQAADGA